MIKEGTVVTMAYRLTNAEGEELDRADKGEPFQYLHGLGQIVPGLEKALTGLLVGSKKQVVVTPDDGYGQIEPQLRTEASLKQFPPGTDMQVGMRFAADDGEGHPIVFMVTGIEGDTVHLDGNHPLAGETLHFDVEILGIREASPQEMEHGHAHGEHGHDH